MALREALSWQSAGNQLAISWQSAGNQLEIRGNQCSSEALREAIQKHSVALSGTGRWSPADLVGRRHGRAEPPARRPCYSIESS